MMTPLRLASVAVLTLGCATLPTPSARAACPQQAEPVTIKATLGTSAPDMRTQIIPEQDLELHYYTPRHSNARELAKVLSDLSGRMFHVQSQDGSASHPVDNVRTFGNVVVLYDRVNRIGEMVKILAQLEQADAEQHTELERMVIAEYRPKYMPAHALMEALSPLRRQILAQSVSYASGAQSGGWTSNVTMLDEPATIVLRDTPENVEQMLALMQRLDVAPPQVQLTCWLLRGTEADTATSLPSDLVDNLSQIAPYDHFRRLCLSMIRTSVQPGQTQKLSSNFEDYGATESFELTLEPAGFDREAGLLPITRCRFQATTGQEFETSVTLRVGEYTVLGAAGSDVLFVVLQVQPLDV